jgi:hypothetical protein
MVTRWNAHRLRVLLILAVVAGLAELGLLIIKAVTDAGLAWENSARSPRWASRSATGLDNSGRTVELEIRYS